MARPETKKLILKQAAPRTKLFLDGKRVKEDYETPNGKGTRWGWEGTVVDVDADVEVYLDMKKLTHYIASAIKNKNRRLIRACLEIRAVNVKEVTERRIENTLTANRG